MIQAGGSLIAILAWVGTSALVASGLYSASLFLRGEFADDAIDDQPHGDSRTAALRNKLESFIHDGSK